MLQLWSFVEADFHREYGVDLSEVMGQVSTRWFLARLLGLSPEAMFRRLADEVPVRMDPEAAERMLIAAMGA